MIVYVETNFLLELAYLQERCDSCKEILEFAKAGTITLALPAFSAAEARSTCYRRAITRREFQKSLRDQISLISRSEPFRGLSEKSKDVVNALVAGDEEARDRLEAAIETLVRNGITIPLTGEVISMARLHGLAYSLSSQDALVFASVLSHADQVTERKCFISQDSKAFDNPAIYDELAAAGCKFISNFKDAVDHIKSKI